MAATGILARWRGGRVTSDTADASHWLTRFVVLRSLGGVYLVAFLVLSNQLLPLLGAEGLTPIRDYLANLRGDHTLFDAFLDRPSLLWFASSDAVMSGLAAFGVALSAVVFAGFANGVLLFLLWLLYLSFVHMGQLWYGFGWEILLLELGFLALFLGPAFDARPFPRAATPRVTLWLLRWLTFRVMFGAGLIKLRGDPCWMDLTCLDYHFETQPNPHPLSWYFHNLPTWMLHAGVVANHLAEVVAPFFVFGPRLARRLAGALIVGFQLVLIASGNLAFLNWLTIVAALGCFDDAVYRRLLPQFLVEASERARLDARPGRGLPRAAWAYAAVVALLSIAPVENLVSRGQIMNTSFDRLHLVNTYGAFGSVGKVRDEIVLQGTLSERLDDETVWVDYEWKCKPGDPMRRPCLITPYHYRLDWLIWFAAMSDYQRHPWVVHLAWKLLHADPGALGLLAADPFDGARPRFVRGELYRYEFTDASDKSGAWWRRRRLRSYLPALDAESDSLRRFLRQRGWLREQD